MPYKNLFPLWWAGKDSNFQCILRHGFTVRLLRQFAYLPIIKEISVHSLAGDQRYATNVQIFPTVFGFYSCDPPSKNKHKNK